MKMPQFVVNFLLWVSALLEPAPAPKKAAVTMAEARAADEDPVVKIDMDNLTQSEAENLMQAMVSLMLIGMSNENVEKMLANISQQGVRALLDCNFSGENALLIGFSWIHSNEEHQYWADVYYALGETIYLDEDDMKIIREVLKEQS